MKAQYIGFGALAILVVAGLLIAKFAGAPSAPGPQAVATEVTVGDLTVSDAWVALPVGDQPRTAAYFTLQNDGDTDERLVGATTPAAATATLHRTVTEDNVSRMESVDALILPSHSEVTFAPGGLHLMLMDLAAPLADGGTVPLTLHFLESGDVMIDAPVRTRTEMMNMDMN